MVPIHQRLLIPTHFIWLQKLVVTWCVPLLTRGNYKAGSLRTLTRRFAFALAGLPILFGFSQSLAFAENFYPDDPIQSMPEPVPVHELAVRKIDYLYDFLANSVKPNPRLPVPAGAINTLGEVPDSAWFTNRHGRKRMTREELQTGPGNSSAPVPPFLVVGAKTEGISPGFRMKDAEGRLYFVKPDPISNPEMATAADVIGSKFFYALGYNTPENYIVNVQRSQLSVGPKALIESGGRERRMTPKDVKVLLDLIPRREDGSYRLMASLAVPGHIVGPFAYEGTRSDDPNDLVSHEQRRDLRGLHVFCAWLNHTDAKGGNTLNSVVEESGIHFVRHYLIDLNAILGSDSDMPKDARFGHEFFFPMPGKALTSIVALGLYSPSWERAKFPKDKPVGDFESKLFDPEKWKSNYPNPAFLSRQPDDEYWAAKQVMAFSDQDIRALVETGQYSDSRVVDYITATLIARRDKIGRTYFAKVLPLDDFAVLDGQLQFKDLGVEYGFASTRQYQVSWSRFDNVTAKHIPLRVPSSFRLPGEIERSSGGSYWAARIETNSNDRKTVTVYLRRNGSGLSVVGVERTW